MGGKNTSAFALPQGTQKYPFKISRTGKLSRVLAFDITLGYSKWKGRGFIVEREGEEGDDRRCLVRLKKKHGIILANGGGVFYGCGQNPYRALRRARAGLSNLIYAPAWDQSKHMVARRPLPLSRLVYRLNSPQSFGKSYANSMRYYSSCQNVQREHQRIYTAGHTDR